MRVSVDKEEEMETVSDSGTMSVDDEPGSGIDTLGRYFAYLAERISRNNCSSSFYKNGLSVSKVNVDYSAKILVNKWCKNDETNTNKTSVACTPIFD